MIGVDIISKTAIMETKPWAISVFGAVLFSLVMLMVVLVHYYTKEKQIKVLIAMIINFVLICAMFLVTPLMERETGRYKYTAHIDDEVSMVEFNKKYTNIEYQDGVWIFEDR